MLVRVRPEELDTRELEVQTYQTFGPFIKQNFAHELARERLEQGL